MNPPFKRLDILFLEKMLTIADLIVHIGPDTILLNNKKYKYEDTILKHIKNVDTIDEAYNFINSIISGSYYYYCYNHFMERNPNWKNIPFMNDYTRPWTDERLKEYFGLTDEEYNIVKNYDKRNK